MNFRSSTPYPMPQPAHLFGKASGWSVTLNLLRLGVVRRGRGNVGAVSSTESFLFVNRGGNNFHLAAQIINNRRQESNVMQTSIRRNRESVLGAIANVCRVCLVNHCLKLVVHCRHIDCTRELVL